MSGALPNCRAITVFAFRGDRSRGFAAAFQTKLTDERNNVGPGPTPTECLLYAGHSGVSFDNGKAIYGFNPDGTNVLISKLLDDLKNGDAYPGIVRDDTAVFTAAQNHSLKVLSFEVRLPQPVFQAFKDTLDDEARNSKYTYGFPNGDGECNCTTWMERLGLPLLTGRMDEFTGLSGIPGNPTRRFGKCI